MGVGVPAEARQRAELAGLVYLCRLWLDSSDFTLDDDRLDAAIDELQRAGEAERGEVEVVAQLRGLQIPVARLELAGVTIVRADTVEVPAEARATDGLGVSPWEPAFLAVVRVEEPDPAGGEEGSEPAIAAVEAFRRLITTLRLYRSGGVALGPYAWARVAGDRWRRIATGSGRLRPGGYRLADGELGELSSFSRALEEPSTPLRRALAGRPGFPATLARAVARFEAGLERNVVVEALNDHLLALRFLLEGSGPAGLGLPMRVAALCAEPDRRPEVKAVVERALGLERELWSGEPAPGERAVTPAETAAALEDLLRAILKDAAAGRLGSDLRTAADEILLADGLAVGEGGDEQRGGTTEWDLELVEAARATDDGIAEEVSELDRRISSEHAEHPEEEMLIARAQEIFAGPVEAETKALGIIAERAEPAAAPAAPADQPPAPPQSPVLRLIEQTRAERKVHHERVAGLFPPPETTEWNVREIAYDRNRRARTGG